MFEVFRITNAAGKAQEETKIPGEGVISLSQLKFYFLKAGEVSLQIPLETLYFRSIFFKTDTPLLPIRICGSQLKLISSIWSDLNSQVNRLGVEAFQSLKIAV